MTAVYYTHINLNIRLLFTAALSRQLMSFADSTPSSTQCPCHRNLTIPNENWENITKYNNGWNSASFPPASSVVVNSSFVLADIFELGDHWRTRDGAPCHRVFQPRPTWPGLKKCCLLSGKVSRKNVAHLLDFIQMRGGRAAQFCVTFSEVHFWSIKGVYFLPNANNLNFKPVF